MWLQRELGKKKKNRMGRKGEGDLPKKNSFKFWGDGICNMQTAYQNAKSNVSDFQNIQNFQGKHAPGPST